MKKKITKEKEESVEKVLEVDVFKEEVNLINKLQLDTGRGDLNQMVEKINEIIEHLNGR